METLDDIIILASMHGLVLWFLDFNGWLNFLSATTLVFFFALWTVWLIRQREKQDES